MSHAERSTGSDPHTLHRFVEAQQRDYDRALAEIRAGQKRSHWMWYIFPQFAGLGLSPIAQHYAIRSSDEARAYLAHPLLGRRLRECAEAALAVEGKTAREIFGHPDDLKLRSSATLFSAVAGTESVFERLLDHFFDGRPDERTLRLLEAGRESGASPDS